MGRVVALDVGTKRIGVAVSDELRILATPTGAIRRHSYNKDAAAIAQIVRETQAERIVVGLPIGLSGGLTEQTRKTQRFAEMLASRVLVPVELWDERLTTWSALKTLSLEDRGRPGRRDAVAAAFILQGYLDHRRASSRSQ
ncbi:MAG: Holliday junction resolvase RuvX [Chloroflexi bacterium]|nr:Holliday junction resolvase RuvX [Chloroflexota bacterium]